MTEPESKTFYLSRVFILIGFTMQNVEGDKCMVLPLSQKPILSVINGPEFHESSNYKWGYGKSKLKCQYIVMELSRVL